MALSGGMQTALGGTPSRSANTGGTVAGGNPLGFKSANDAFAAMTRQQWDDYLSVWVPFENANIAYATDPATVDNAVKQARSDVAQSFDMQQGIQERRLRGLGVSLDADEQRANKRAMGLAEGLADVNAANVAQTRTRDRQRAVMGMPTPQG